MSRIAPKSPRSTESLVDWSNYVGVVETATQSPHYCGKRQVVLMTVEGDVFLPSGKELQDIIYIKNRSGGAITIKTEDSATIDDETEIDVSIADQTLAFAFDGENWFII